MFYIVETQEQLNKFCLRGYNEAFVEIIPFNDAVHPALNNISLIYVKPLIDPKGYIFCINHSESLSLSLDEVSTALRSIEKVYVLDKKSFLYYFIYKHICQLTSPPPTYIHPPVFDLYKSHSSPNRLIPISKHYEKCTYIYNQIKDFTPVSDFKDLTIKCFFHVESQGIRIDQPTFATHYENYNTARNIQDNTIYTQYNLDTTTSRPSNTFNGVNFLAIPKNTGARKSFIPKNSKFVEIDISAYHPALAANLVGFDFGDDDIHNAFAQMYGVSYQEAKTITFQQMYGGVFEAYKDLEFFKKIGSYINDKWEEFNNAGQIIVPISGYCLKKDKLDNMNPQKLFNYVLQGLETANNVRILMDVIKLLKGKNTQVVLYTYDAFLLDWDENENILNDIINIFKHKGLQTKLSYGKSYDFTQL